MSTKMIILVHGLLILATTLHAEAGTSTDRCQQSVKCANGRTLQCDVLANEETGASCIWNAVPGVSLMCRGWDSKGDFKAFRETCPNAAEGKAKIGPRKRMKKALKNRLSTQPRANYGLG